MRAAWYERGGPAAEVLQYGTMDAPEPGAGEVRVKMAWSAVNPHDTKKRAQAWDEAKRLQDLFRSVSGEDGKVAAANAKSRDEQAARITALEQRLAKLDTQMAEAINLLKSPPAAAAPRTTAVLSDAQAKDMRTTLAEVNALKKEVAALRSALERNSAALEPGMPVFRREGQ